MNHLKKSVMFPRVRNIYGRPHPSTYKPIKMTRNQRSPIYHIKIFTIGQTQYTWENNQVYKSFSPFRHTVSLNPESNISIISSTISGTSISSSCMQYELCSELEESIFRSWLHWSVFLDAGKEIVCPSELVLPCFGGSREQKSSWVAHYLEAYNNVINKLQSSIRASQISLTKTKISLARGVFGGETTIKLTSMLLILPSK